MLAKVFALAAFAILQASFLPKLGLGANGPDLVLVGLLLWSVQMPLRDSVLLTFIGGLFVSSLSFLPLGSESLGLLPAVFALDLLRQRFYKIGFLHTLSIIWLATLSKFTLQILLASFLGYGILFQDVSNFLPERIFYNSLCFLAYYGFMLIKTRFLLRNAHEL